MGQANQTWIIPVLLEIRNKTLTSGHLNPHLPEAPDMAIAVLDMLQTLARQNFADTYMRVFSIQCFHDSKYFEKNLRSRLVALIRS